MTEKTDWPDWLGECYMREESKYIVFFFFLGLLLRKYREIGILLLALPYEPYEPSNPSVCLLVGGPFIIS